ncbi:MAG: nitrilase-related carbon-nitrogen hydrolase [Patulibacter sp.]
MSPVTAQPPPRRLRALLAQTDSQPGRFDANVARLGAALTAHPAVEIAVFPELFLSGYGADAVAEGARRADELGAVCELAQQAGTAVVCGFAERDGDRVYDSVLCVDAAGRLAGVYRKSHLFDGERDVFSAGDELLVVELAGLRVGVLNCMDIEFCEPARDVAIAGAELLVTVSANMAPYWDCHDLASRARAHDNRLPHLYSNRVGAEAGLRFVGGSRAIDSSGQVIAEANRDHEELVEVELDLDRGEPRLDYVRLRRGSLPVRFGTDAEARS